MVRHDGSVILKFITDCHMKIFSYCLYIGGKFEKSLSSMLTFQKHKLNLILSYEIITFSKAYFSIIFML